MAHSRNHPHTESDTSPVDDQRAPRSRPSEEASEHGTAGLPAIVRRQWILIAVVTGIAVATAVLITLRTTPLYASTSTLFVSTSAGDDAAAAYQGACSASNGCAPTPT